MAGDDFGKLLVQAYLRASAGLFVSAFGSPRQQETVGCIFDNAPEEEKQAAREYLDRVAEKITGGR
jgi:hypothetical protein